MKTIHADINWVFSTVVTVKTAAKSELKSDLINLGVSTFMYMAEQKKNTTLFCGLDTHNTMWMAKFTKLVFSLANWQLQL